MASAPFATLPLDPVVQQIRLVELQPGTADDAIRCYLRTFPLAEAPPYVALSHTWGRQEPYRDILLNDAAYSLSRNLWWFLNLRRVAGKTTLLWIDALCIDQANTEEKSQQVKILRDIYTTANSVAIWLGEADTFTDSNLAMDYILRQDSKPLRQIGYGFRSLWTARQGRSLLGLLQRNYWKRVWVVQEIIHANNLTVYCGSKQFPWKCLETLFNKLKIIAENGRIEHHRYAASLLASPARVMVDAKSSWRRDKSAPLQTLLTRCRELQCTDVRDRVFGLLGLASDAHLVTLDYSLPPKEIFHDALRNISATYHPVDWDEAIELGKLLRDILMVRLPDEQLKGILSSSLREAWNIRRSHTMINNEYDVLPSSPSMLLDPANLADLSAHFDRLLFSVQQRWEALNNETARAPSTSYGRGDGGSDDDIQHFRDILQRIDELQAEFEKIRQIGEIVKGFRARVETLDRRL